MPKQVKPQRKFGSNSNLDGSSKKSLTRQCENTASYRKDSRYAPLKLVGLERPHSQGTLDGFFAKRNQPNPLPISDSDETKHLCSQQKRQQMKQFALSKKRENGVRKRLELPVGLTQNKNAKSYLLSRTSLNKYKQNKAKLDKLEQILVKSPTSSQLQSQ